MVQPNQAYLPQTQGSLSSGPSFSRALFRKVGGKKYASAFAVQLGIKVTQVTTAYYSNVVIFIVVIWLFQYTFN